MKTSILIGILVSALGASTALAQEAQCRQGETLSPLGICQADPGFIVSSKLKLVENALHKGQVNASNALFYKDELNLAFEKSRYAMERSDIKALENQLNRIMPKKNDSCAEGFKKNSLNTCSLDVISRLTTLESDIQSHKVTSDNAQVYTDELNLLLKNSADRKEQKTINEDLKKVAASSTEQPGSTPSPTTGHTRSRSTR